MIRRALLQTRAFSNTNLTGVVGNKHRSNAEALIAQANVIEVDGATATCDGGGGVLGHPIEYIQLAKRDPHTPETCKVSYLCGCG